MSSNLNNLCRPERIVYLCPKKLRFSKSFQFLFYIAILMHFKFHRWIRIFCSIIKSHAKIWCSKNMYKKTQNLGSYIYLHFNYNNKEHLRQNKIVSRMLLSEQTKAKFFFDCNHFREIFIRNTVINMRRKKNTKCHFLPFWILSFLKSFRKLNHIQTSLFPVAFGTNLNMLLVSPTGTGKTVVAGLCILRLILNSMRQNKLTYRININHMKIVYIAPLKTLVKEIHDRLKICFTQFNLQLTEMTGDRKINHPEIARSQIIIGTPEKIHIFLKNQESTNFLHQIRLLIIDEIHLLNDKRGIVLEQTIMKFVVLKKTKRQSRLLGLSATLPNFFDVAKFLNVNISKGLFFFGNSFREVALHQTLIGIRSMFSRKNFIHTMNEIVHKRIISMFEKKKSSSIIIFVQSRKDTFETASFLMGKFKNTHKNPDSTDKSISMKNLIEHKIGIHHAGLSKRKKLLIENFFREKKINILVSTTTLAWGVNLPASDVIIKGTRIYSPEIGTWREISNLDIIQMMGRAGRCPFARSSEAILITSLQKLNYYISLANYQLPIESRLIDTLPDALNIELSRKKITNICWILQWFSKTYFFTRLFRIVLSEKKITTPKSKRNFQKNLENRFVVQVLKELKSAGFIIVSKKGNLISNTKIGLIAAENLINHQTFMILLSKLRPNNGLGELLNFISMSIEFSELKIRKDEIRELERLKNYIIFPIKGSTKGSRMKINILIQSFIKNLRIFNLSLVADSIFIAKMSSRITKTLFQIGLLKRWSAFTSRCFELYKGIKNRTWSDQNLLRLSLLNPSDDKYVKFLEQKKINPRLFSDLKKHQLVRHFHSRKAVNFVEKIINFVPNIRAQIVWKPITRNTMKLSVLIQLHFDRNRFFEKQLGFWLFIQDQITDSLICYKYFSFSQKLKMNTIVLNFCVPVFDNPITPYYVVKINNFDTFFPNFEKIVNLTDLLLSVNHPISTQLSAFKKVPFARLVCGVSFGNIILEYFESHGRNIIGFFYQIYSSILKHSGSNIVSSVRNGVKSIFSEFSSYSLLVHRRKLTFFVFSSGVESIALKKLKFKTSSLGVLGISIKKIDTKVLFKINKSKKKKAFLVLGYCEWVAFKTYLNSHFLGEFAFWTDEFHLLRDKNFGNHIEAFCQDFLQSRQLGKKIILIGSLFPILNLKEMIEWLIIDSSQIFSIDISQNSVEKIPLIKSPRKKNDIKIYQNLHHAILFPKKTNLKTPMSICVLFEKKKEIKNKFFAFLFRKNNFFSFLHNTSRIIYHENFFNMNISCKIIKLFLGFRIGYLASFHNYKQRKIITELYSSKSITKLFMTTGCLAMIDHQKISSEAVILNFEQSNKSFLPFFSSKASFLLSKFRLINLCVSSKNVKDDINISTAFPTESVWNVFLRDNLLKFIIEQKIKDFKKVKEFLFSSFFSKRIYQNTNYYGLITTHNLHHSLCTKIRVILKKLIKNRLHSTQNLNTIVSYYLFSGKIIKLFAIKAIESASFHFLNKIIVESNELHLIKLFMKIEKCTKKVLFDVSFLNRLKSNNGFNEYIKYLISCFNRQLSTILSGLLILLGQNRDLRSILFHLEVRRVLIRGVWQTNSKLLTIFNLNHFEVFLIGKIHQIFSVDCFCRQISAHLHMKNHYYKVFLRKVLQNTYVIFNLILNCILRKKEKRNVISFRISIDKYHLKVPDFMHNMLNFKPKLFNWWFIVGNLDENCLIFFKKLSTRKGGTFSIAMRSKKTSEKLKIFMINSTILNMDKEISITLCD